MSPQHGDDRTPGTGRASGPGPSGDRPVSALPSVQARVLAFAAILLAGLCGALIGWGFVGVQCTGSCSTKEGAGAVVGAAIAAAGVAVVAVLTLRAMGEWKTIKQDRALAEAADAARAGLAAWAGDGPPGPPPEADPADGPGAGPAADPD